MKTIIAALCLLLFPLTPGMAVAETTILFTANSLGEFDPCPS